MDKLDSTTVIQIGLIVKDIRKTARNYARIFGIPEPEVVPIANDAFAKTCYKGKASTASALGAFFKLGSVEMELIEPVGAPSTWEEFLRTRGEGIHHLAIKTENMEEAQHFLTAQGMETIQDGGWDGGQYAYIYSSEPLGTILELLHFD